MNNPTYTQTLQVLADYRMLSIVQLSMLLFKSDQMTRRCLRKLAQDKLISRASLQSQGKKGRPETIILPTEKGLETIGCPPCTSPTKNQTNHQLATNWVRIQTHHLHQIIPTMHIQTCAANSLLKQNAKLWLDGTGENYRRLIPDAIMCLGHDTRKILFFVEMDMGTESEQSSSGHTNNLEHKVTTYAAALSGKTYSHLNKEFDAKFNGFRTLIVAHSQPRLDQINRYLKGYSTTGFVWTTSLAKILSDGIGGDIWSSGGREPDQTILGGLKTS